MKLLDRLERKLGRYAIRNVTLYLVCGQILTYVGWLAIEETDELSRLALIPNKVLEGELWRLVTFVVMPPPMDPIFAFFALYLFYLFGTALENQWGAFRYNVYLIIAYLATLGAAFGARLMFGPMAGNELVANVYMEGSVFLAFAYLYPDFQLLLFFIFPVKVKWLALLACLGYIMVILDGSGLERMLVLAAVLNFLIFFGPEIVQRLKNKKRAMKHRAERAEEAEGIFHRCTHCGKTDKSHPDTEFRYCDQCHPALCYCTDHINNHAHRRSIDPREATTAEKSAD